MDRSLAQPTHLGAVDLIGLATWSDAWPEGEAQARRVLRDEAPPQEGLARRPAADLLPPAERRRAADAVALSLGVAAQAVAQAGCDPARLPSVFTSAHGDLPLTDYLCETLASDPALLSPTKFHQSVHNAASGQWTQAVGCHRASLAMSAWEASFGHGLLEAMAQCLDQQEAVLLVACDLAAVGSLQALAPSRGRLAVAAVLAPAGRAGPQAPRARLRLAGLAAGGGATAPASRGAAALAGQALADALPWLEALASAGERRLVLPLGPQCSFALDITGFEPPPA